VRTIQDVTFFDVWSEQGELARCPPRHRVMPKPARSMCPLQASVAEIVCRRSGFNADFRKA
jgi:hypothetical protein